MLGSVKSLLKRVIYAGIVPDMLRSDARHVVMANEIAFAIIVMNGVVLSNPRIELVAAGTRLAVIAQSLAMVVVFALNHFRKPWLASTLQLVAANGFVAGGTLYQPWATDNVVFFITTGIAPWFVFPARCPASRVFWTTFAFAGLLITSFVTRGLAHPTALSDDELWQLANGNHIACFLVVVIACVNLTRETRRLEREIARERSLNGYRTPGP